MKKFILIAVVALVLMLSLALTHSSQVSAKAGPIPTEPVVPLASPSPILLQF